MGGEVVVVVVEREKGEEEMERTRVVLGAAAAPEVVYPAPLLSHEEVCRSPLTFLDTLRRFHCTLGTRFMIPVIGGKDLDLHLLYEQVTQRGGLEKVILERRWREVIAAFNFPPTTTSASFVLRKYYLSLLHHFEQVYFFRAQGPLIAPAAALQTKTYTNSDSIMAAFRRRKRPLVEPESQEAQPLPFVVHGNGFASSGSSPLPHPPVESATMGQNFPPTASGNVSVASGSVAPAPAVVPPTPAIGVQPIPSVVHGNGFASSAPAPISRPLVGSRPAPVAQNFPPVIGGNGSAASILVPPAPVTGVPPALATGPYNFTVTGTIDGKFEHGYFVTVKISSQILRGVLYHAAQAPASAPLSAAAPSNVIFPSTTPTARVHRRRRRLRYRDPAHPKPNRSAYNFFFAEKHSKLKVLFPQREREFSKMIGESWNKLTEEEREVFHAFGRKDKERYRREMQEYRERLKLAPVREAARPMEPANVQVDAAVFRVI